MQFRNLAKEFRVKDWYHYLGFILIGYFSSFRGAFVISNLLIPILLTSFLLGYIYSMNNFFDKKTTKKLFLIPLLFIFLFFPFLSIFQIVSSLIFIFLFSWYNIKLKNFPSVSTTCNAMGFPILYLIGANNLGYAHIIFFLLLTLTSLVAQLIHEIVHLEEDRTGGRKTTAIFLGKERSVHFLKIFLTITSVYTFFLGIQLKMVTMFLTGFFLFLFTVYFWNKMAGNDVRVMYKKIGIVSGGLILLELILMA